ncbi:sulfotransferase-like domain-containing protein [Streptomyces olivaceoviridis]|uniref:sulfotransferase-like domain-containing protein n=1 Tax=Streptomyces olivaceoviridis TaxID=1921 RepID=UPI0036FE0E6F
MSYPILFLWSTPRSLSTAFLRMMLERGDFFVVHEPLSSIVSQGFATIGDERVESEAGLVELLREKSRNSAVFVKEVTDSRYGLIDDPAFPHLATHTFLLRHPEQSIASHHAMKPEVNRDEIGYEHLLDVFDTVRVARAEVPVVIEAERLLADPGTVVRDYCLRTGIAFLPSAMTWTPDDRREWSRTAPWHRDAAGSSGFTVIPKTYRTTVHNDPRLAAFHAHHLPFYERLRAHAVPAAGQSVGAGSR